MMVSLFLIYSKYSRGDWGVVLKEIEVNFP